MNKARDLKEIIDSAQGSLARYMIQASPRVMMVQSVHDIAVVGGLFELMVRIAKLTVDFGARRPFLAFKLKDKVLSVYNSGKKLLHKEESFECPVPLEIWAEQSGEKEVTLLLPGDH